MGGRSSEPVVAGKNPEWMAKASKCISILATESEATVGSGSVCAQAQWQSPASPNTQSPASSAAEVTDCSEGASMDRALAVEATIFLYGPSVRHIVPAASLINNTATANTHRPRWRRRRVSSDGWLKNIVKA